jgi:ABC-type dipeptide/oligopeptide/nickel transport system ATPase component
MDLQVATGLAAANFLRFPVQYNPSSISIHASAGSFPDYRAMGDSGQKQYTMVEREATTYMDVQLLFEDINYQDAFMTENLNPTAGNVVDMIGQGIRTAMDDMHSIKAQVEGLIAMLLHEKTRRVVFFWSQMFFHGEVESVDATYTMFNKLGDPIKANVNLTIRQAASGDEYKSDDEYWDKAYKQVFKETGMVSSASKMVDRLFGS